jgi:CRP-like cAMP-binding protein
MLGTLSTHPEEKLVEQGEKATAIYFIVSGESMIFHYDLLRQDLFKKSLLSSGDHFGEIGCLYDCNRTCTVLSINYNILARLSK